MRQLGILLGGILFLYVASIGPVYGWAFNHNEDETPQDQMIEKAYGPIIYLCHSFKPINYCVVVYVKMWARLMDRKG